MSGCGSGGSGCGYAGSSVSIWMVMFAVGKRAAWILNVSHPDVYLDL